MNENKRASISKGRSYQEIGEFWDTHDLGAFWEECRPVAFKVASRLERTYCPVEPKLAAKLRVAAKKRGISTETLVNLWLQERLTEASKTG